MKKKVLTGIIGVMGGVASYGIYTNAATEIGDYLDNHEDEHKFIKFVNVIGITFKNVAATWCTLMLLSNIFNYATNDSEK